MKSLGLLAEGLRLERMRASTLWAGNGFRNAAPIRPGLRDPAARFPTLADFPCGGTRRVPTGPLPAMRCAAAHRAVALARLCNRWGRQRFGPAHRRGPRRPTKLCQRRPVKGGEAAGEPP